MYYIDPIHGILPWVSLVKRWRTHTAAEMVLSRLSLTAPAAQGISCLCEAQGGCPQLSLHIEPSAPFSDVLKSGLLSPLARMHGDDLWQEATIDLLLSDSSSPFVQKLHI